MGPHTHVPAPAARGWRTPAARRMGGQSGEGEGLTSDAPHNGGRHPPLGTPFRHPHCEQCQPARAHAVRPVLGPHARTDRTWDTRVAEPGLPAPEDGRPGERQRLTPDAPHNGGRPPPPGDGPPPPPRHAAPTGHAGQGDGVGPPQPHTRTHSTWVADPNGPPSAWAVGGGIAPDLRRPSQRSKAPPPGRPSATPTASNAGPQGRTLWGRCWVPTPAPTAPGTPRLPVPEDGRLWEGQRLTPDAPHHGGRQPPPGTASHHPRGTQPPQGMQAKRTVFGPQTHTPAPTACGLRTPTTRPVGRQFGEGERLTTDTPHNGGRQAPGNAPPPPPQRATPACKGARCGAGAGSRARTDRTQDTWVAEPRLPAPEGGHPGEGQRLTPDAPHNGGRPLPPGTAPHHPHGTQPPRGTQAKGIVMGPHRHTPAPTARG